MILCSCEGVSETMIRASVRCGARSVEGVGRRCGAGTSCNGCHRVIREVISDEEQRQPALELPTVPSLPAAFPAR